jgi:predicted DNA-binding protein YlxM (UPF0122 family)
MGKLYCLLERGSIMAKKKKPDIDGVSSEIAHFGRPTEYKDTYPQMLVEHMAEGYSFESFAGIVDVDRQTIYNWKDKHPDFLDAFRRGKSKMLLKDEETLNKGIRGDIKANGALMALKMYNCHNWTSKSEVTEKAAKNMNEDELLKEAEELVAKAKEKKRD